VTPTVPTPSEDPPAHCSPAVESLLRRPRGADGYYDWCGEDLGNEEFKDWTCKKVRFGSLVGARFEGVNFTDVDFRYATLEDTRIRHSNLTRCDFRYMGLEKCSFVHSRFDGATFTGAVLLECDLYRTVFVASSLFSHALFYLVSISGATLAGTIDLRKATFCEARGNAADAPPAEHPGSSPYKANARKRREIVLKNATSGSEKPALVQQADETVYQTFLEPVVDKTLSDPTSLRVRFAEAAGVWRALSALWTSQGALSDAAWAYEQTKRLERKDMSPLRRQGPGRWSHSLRWAGLWLAGGLCSFGNSLGRVLGWLVVLTCGWGVVYSLTDAVRVNGSEASFGKSMIFSVAQLTTAVPNRYTVHAGGAELFASAETLCGVALLGLFGFVLGNKLRSA
jgi:Pentapeptide repeats (9 copies)